MAFTDCDSVLVTTSDDGFARRFDVATGKLLLEEQIHNGEITDLQVGFLRKANLHALPPFVGTQEFMDERTRLRANSTCISHHLPSPATPSSEIQIMHLFSIRSLVLHMRVAWLLYSVCSFVIF